jgi:hypothetical protein
MLKPVQCRGCGDEVSTAILQLDAVRIAKLVGDVGRWLGIPQLLFVAISGNNLQESEKVFSHKAIAQHEPLL